MSASRVGRKPVVVPSGVNVKLSKNILDIKGPKGQLQVEIHSFFDLLIEDNKVQVVPNSETKYCRKGSGRHLLNSLPGTIRSTINNAIIGVTKGFERKLQLVGVGYRAQAKGDVLNLTLGYSHAKELKIPRGITVETPTLTDIVIKGADKYLVGYVAAKIKKTRPQEPYKGKGVVDPLKLVLTKETKKK